MFPLELRHLIRCSSLQDEHGEVCPANWSEGGKTIKADPTEKLEYFAAVDDAAKTNGASNKRPRTD